MAVYYEKQTLKRVHPDDQGLALMHNNMGEKWLRLKLDHPNYEAIYSLAYIAATNGLPLLIRTEDDRETILYVEISLDEIGGS